MKLLLSRALILVSLLVTLSGCDGNESWCLTTAPNAYNSSNVLTTTNTPLTINANGVDPAISKTPATYNQWVSSKVTVIQGQTISVSATGNIVLAPAYGLSPQYNVAYTQDPTQSASMTAYDNMLSGSSVSQFYDNSGYGTQYVVKPNVGLTQVNSVDSSGVIGDAAFPFVAGQNITVTTKNCATRDQNSTTPTKWTWNNGWVKQSIYCQSRGTGTNFTADTSGCDPMSSECKCKALKNCSYTCGGIFTCYEWRGWICYPDRQTYLDYNDDSLSGYSTDVCPSNSNTNFNCASNANDDPARTGASCGGSYEGYTDMGSAAFCGGRDSSGFVDHSKKSPGCGFGTGDVNTPTLNTCGNSDTCWNVDGFRLYAVQSNVNTTCSSYPVNNNCVHLYQSSATEGGKAFSAAGGALSLVIADPNIANEGIVDVASYQTKYNSNVSTIATNQADNISLNDSIVTQKLALNNFAGLDCSQVYYLQTIAGSYALTLSSTDSSIASSLSSILNDLITLNNNCNNLVTQLSPTYVASPSGSTPWKTTLTEISSNLTRLKTSANNLNTSSSVSSNPSAADLASYKALLTGILNTMDSKANVSNFDSMTLPGIRIQGASLSQAVDSVSIAITNAINTMNYIQLLLNNGDTNLTNYNLDSFNKQISSSYVESALCDPTPPDASATYCDSATVANLTCTPSWYNTVSLIPEKLTELQGYINTIETGGGNKQSYASAMKSMKDSLSNIANSLISNFNTYKANNNLIIKLSDCNVYLDYEKNKATSRPSGTTGGYTVYIKADPVIASNGEKLQMVLSNGNPNNGDSYTSSFSANPCNITNSTVSCTVTMTNAGTIWFKVNDPDGVYDNNLGSYTVTIGTASTTSGFDTIFTSIVKQITSVMGDASNVIFNNLVCGDLPDSTRYVNCGGFLSILSAVLLLYIIIFGMMFLFGLIKTDYLDFLIRIVKVSIVIILMKPNSYTFFKTYLFDGFLKFSSFVISATTGNPSSNPFVFLGESIAALLLDPITYFKLIALMFQGITGIIVFVLFIYSIVCFLKAVFSALKIFIMSVFGMGVCAALAPFFLSFLLFDKTKYLFDNWFKAMVRFTLEPIVLFTGLIILNAMLIGLIHQLFNFSVCFKCTIPFGFYIPGLFTMGNGTLFCIPWFSPWGMDNLGNGTAFNSFFKIPVIISFFMVTKVMKIYSEKLAMQISDAILGDSVSPGTSFGSREGKTQMGMNPFDDFIKGVRQITGTTKDDLKRRSQGMADELINRIAGKDGKSENAAQSTGKSTDDNDIIRPGSLNDNSGSDGPGGGLTDDNEEALDSINIKSTNIKHGFLDMVHEVFRDKREDMKRQMGLILEMNKLNATGRLVQDFEKTFNNLTERMAKTPANEADKELAMKKLNAILKIDIKNKANKLAEAMKLLKLVKEMPDDMLNIKIGKNDKGEDILLGDALKLKLANVAKDLLNEDKGSKKLFDFEMKKALGVRRADLDSGDTALAERGDKARAFTKSSAEVSSGPVIDEKLAAKLQDRRIKSDKKYTADESRAASEAMDTKVAKVGKKKGELESVKDQELLAKLQDRRKAVDLHAVEGVGEAVDKKVRTHGYDARQDASIPKLANDALLEGINSSRKKSETKKEKANLINQINEDGSKQKDRLKETKVVGRFESQQKALQSTNNIDPDLRNQNDKSMLDLKGQLEGSRNKIQEMTAAREALRKIDDHMKDFNALTKEEVNSMIDNIKLIKSLDPKYLKMMNQDNLKKLISISESNDVV
jgi:type IV secretory pathway VirB6-like protein